MKAVIPHRRFDFIVLCAAALFLCSSGTTARGEIELIGTARLPGDATDRSGLTGMLAGGIPENRFGGISAIEFTGAGDKYLLVSDRGPGDGATAYRCRFHELKLVVRPAGKMPVAATLVATTLLADEQGRSLTGSAAGFETAGPATWLRFDPEGLRTDRHGKIFISDEYGPSLFQFSMTGERTAVLKVPARFLVARPSADPAEESALNSSGRQTNGGLEGLAIVPDGTRLYASMQRPLIQESEPAKKGKRTGTSTRILEFDLKQGSTREFLYPLDESVNGVSEILAVNDHEFLVLERDGRGGTDARNKKVFKVDLSDATDISSRNSLPATGIPEGVTPVRKTLFLDFLAPKFGLAGPDFPEKIEGLAFGPDLPNGRRLLIVAIDNDFIAAKPILLHAFAIDRDDLPGFNW
jgi:hypothetical protein